MNERVDLLVALFESIARTRMAGVPVLHPALGVEAVGFRRVTSGDGAEPADLVGILITPWFMNLVALPLVRVESADGVGRVRTRELGGHRFEFIGAHEPALGAFAACSLFSPMSEFADAEAARATALAVLDALRGGALPAAPPVPGPVPVPAPAHAASTSASASAVTARRSFLFGRSAAGEGPR